MFNWFQRSSKSSPHRAKSIRPGQPTIGAHVLSGDPKALAALPDAARQLSLDAQRVLANLPGSVRPGRCCAQFPQAVEKLLSSWRDPRTFRAAVDSMLIDRRGGRQGFPFDIVTELSTLREYYDVYVDPIRRTAWDTVDRR